MTTKTRLNSALFLAVCFFAVVSVPIAHGELSKGTLDAGALTCTGAPGDCGYAVLAYRERSQLHDETNNVPYSSLRQCSAIVPEATLGTRFLSSRIRWEMRSHVRRARDIQALSLGSFITPVGLSGERLDLPQSRRPSWAYYGTWDISESAIILPDTKRKSVFHYSLGTNIAREVTASNLANGNAFQLGKIALSLGTSYVVENGDGHLLWLDANFTIKKEINLIGKTTAQNNKIGSVFDWVEAGNEIAILGDIETNGKWVSGISIVPKTAGAYVNLVATMDTHSKSRNYTRLSYPVLAAAGNKIYILLAEGTPGIYEVTGKGLRRISCFPIGFNVFPEIGNVITEKTIAAIHSRLRNTSMPVALYGFGEKLFLLLHRPSTPGHIWSLVQIDPVAEKLIAEKILPTSAADIVLIPGRSRWAIVQKDPVLGLGDQPVHSIVFFSLKPELLAKAVRRPTAPAIFRVADQAPLPYWANIAHIHHF